MLFSIIRNQRNSKREIKALQSIIRCGGVQIQFILKILKHFFFSNSIPYILSSLASKRRPTVQLQFSSIICNLCFCFHNASILQCFSSILFGSSSRNSISDWATAANDYLTTKLYNTLLLFLFWGAEKSSLDFLRLSFNIIRAAANAILKSFAPPKTTTTTKKMTPLG